ncbi:CHASE2 domain-containing protein [Luteimonas sp. RD2P54]|uniref:diguanylate cyclase n=1 Tax=Luteimonas endophytica TaxID=3042023 RepID=A0ABT6J970_9GAMM|nr:CHASE2 domain-containing protein [Luteimonas endophytica]MDH5823359.1 CHASE2 domain-containing protein [Luteimonas endophytica]
MPGLHRHDAAARMVAALLATLAVCVLLSLQLTWRADAWIYDALLSRFDQPVDPRIAIVAIDERSLSEIGRWPWSRGVHARLLDRLRHAGVRGIALNAVFAEPATGDPAGDAALARALAATGSTVLPVMAEPSEPGGMPIEVMPMPPLAEAAAGLGQVDVEIDRDGIARRAYLKAGLGSAYWPSLALALLRVGPAAADDAPLPGLRLAGQPGPLPFQWVRDHHILVPYAEPGAFTRVSYLDVLEGTVDPALLRDRWVLVGVTAAGIDHGLATPRTGGVPRVPAIEYHANLLNALATGQAIAPLPAPWRWLPSIALVLLPLALYGGPGPWRRPSAVTAAVALATLLGCALLLRYGRYWFPPAATLAVLAGGCLAWTLTRLRQSQHLAHSDALTLLANRRMFDLTLARELGAARRSGRPLSLLLVDIDHFKHYNDRHGHQAGDEVLRRIAGAIGSHARRPRDLAARYGGDELAVILPETTAAAAEALAGALVDDVRALRIPHPDSDVAPCITLTIGVATFDPEREPGPVDLLKRADAALYRGKHQGRDRSAAVAAPA